MVVLEEVETALPLHFATDILVIHEALDIQGNFIADGTHHFLQLFAFIPQTNSCAFIAEHVQFVLSFEFLSKVMHQSIVQIPAAQIRIDHSVKHLITDRIKIRSDKFRPFVHER
jgi:hypothetical protein